jgi:hypothetical protein
LKTKIYRAMPLGKQRDLHPTHLQKNKSGNRDHRGKYNARESRSLCRGVGEMTYTICVEPGRAGQVIAKSSDGHNFATTAPLLDGARYWQSLNAPSNAPIVTVWSSGGPHWSLRSTIGHAAKFTVEANELGKPVFRSYRKA